MDRIVADLVLCQKAPSEAGQWLGARVICNLCASEKVGPTFVAPNRIDGLMDMVMLGFESSVKQFKNVSESLSIKVMLIGTFRLRLLSLLMLLCSAKAMEMFNCSYSVL